MAIKASRVVTDAQRTRWIVAAGLIAASQFLAAASSAQLLDPALPDPLLRELIAKCREKLPSKPAEALMLRLDDGGRHSDLVLAQRAKTTLNTFLQNFTRARKLLLECLQKQKVTL